MYEGHTVQRQLKWSYMFLIVIYFGNNEYNNDMKINLIKSYEKCEVQMLWI